MIGCLLPKKKKSFLLSTMFNATPSSDDPNYHLHLHHFDHPGVVLLSQPLIEENY